MSARERFRELLAAPDVYVLPGGFSPFMARMAEEVGFEGFFLAGSQATQHDFGIPNGMATMTETLDSARRVSAACNIGVMVDGDTGYGNAADTYRFVHDLTATTRAAAVFIEDRELPRSRGYEHTCVPLDEAIAKYRAAVAARDSVDASMVICARCTVLQTKGGTLDDAVARATSYVREAGVDFIYLDNVRTRDAAREVCRRIPCPVLPSYSGPPPAPSFAEWTEMGAAVVSNAGSTTRVAVQAVWEFLHELRDQGPVAQTEWNDRARASRWGDASVQMSKATAGDELRTAERFLPD